MPARSRKCKLKSELFDWTPEREAELRKLVVVDGMSQGAIEHYWKDLPNAPSRSAIGGKITRLGLSVTTPSQNKNSKPKPPPTEKAPSAVTSHVGGQTWISLRRIEGGAKSHPPSARSDVEPLISNVVDLSGGHCRFPIGDPTRPDFGFCGRSSSGASVYCANHHRIAYQPKPAVKERKRAV